MFAFGLCSLVPQKMKVLHEMLSPFSKSLLIYEHRPHEKLIPNLFYKNHYVVDYTALKLYRELGMKLVKIQCIRSFSLSAWTKLYIDFRTIKRKEATSPSIARNAQISVNATFGKTMERLHGRNNLKLVTNTQRATRIDCKANT